MAPSSCSPEAASALARFASATLRVFRIPLKDERPDVCRTMMKPWLWLQLLESGSDAGIRFLSHWAHWAHSHSRKASFGPCRSDVGSTHTLLNGGGLWLGLRRWRGATVPGNVDQPFRCSQAGGKGMRQMDLHLVDHDPDVASALEDTFSPHSEVSVSEGDILSRARCAVVSPANCFGNMDGGIDRVYVDFFGQEIQWRVQELIEREPTGRLRIGLARLVQTGHERIPFMIVAPTMEVPQPIPAANVFFAMAAVLRLADESPELTEVFVPGLGTGVGHVDPADAALEMEAAYSKWKDRKNELESEGRGMSAADSQPHRC